MAYASGWTSIIEFQNGQVVSDKFDATFANIDAGLSALSDLELDVTDHEQRIGDNETALTDHEQRISSVESFVTQQEGKVYASDKATSVDIPTQAVWTPVVSVAVPTHQAGIYEFKVSVSFTYETTTNSALLRFSTDGGSTWNEFRVEPKDIADVIPWTYFYPVNATENQGLSLEFEASKESADTMTVLFADVIIDQK